MYLGFITIFTTACHLSVLRTTWIQSTPSHPIFLTPILILFPYLCLDLPSSLLPLGLSTTYLYASLLFPRHATFPTRIIILQRNCNLKISTQQHSPQVCATMQEPQFVFSHPATPHLPGMSSTTDWSNCFLT